MIGKKSVIYRFLCIWWVLINMAPRNSTQIYATRSKIVPDISGYAYACDVHFFLIQKSFDAFTSNSTLVTYTNRLRLQLG